MGNQHNTTMYNFTAPEPVNRMCLLIPGAFRFAIDAELLFLSQPLPPHSKEHLCTFHPHGGGGPNHTPHTITGKKTACHLRHLFPLCTIFTHFSTWGISTLKDTVLATEMIHAIHMCGRRPFVSVSDRNLVCGAMRGGRAV